MMSLKSVIIIPLIGFITFSAFGVWAAMALMNLKVGDLAPDFELRTIDGKILSLGDLKGKFFILAFWKLGQERSQEVLSDLEQIHREFQDKGLIILAVNGDESSDEEIRRFQTAHNLSYYFASDKGLTLYGQFGVIVLPSTLIIGPEGKLAYFLPIHGRDSYLQLRAHLRFFLGEISSDQLDAEINRRDMTELSEARKKAIRYLNLGLLLIDAGLMEKAREAFINATVKDSSLPEPHVQLAKIYSQDKDVKNAGVELSRALELFSRPKDNKLLQGITHARRGEDEAAMTLFKEVIEENSAPPPEAYYEMGRIYEKRNKPSQALESYQMALKLISLH